MDHGPVGDPRLHLERTAGLEPPPAEERPGTAGGGVPVRAAHGPYPGLARLRERVGVEPHGDPRPVAGLRAAGGLTAERDAPEARLVVGKEGRPEVEAQAADLELGAVPRGVRHLGDDTLPLRLGGGGRRLRFVADRGIAEHEAPGAGAPLQRLERPPGHGDARRLPGGLVDLEGDGDGSRSALARQVGRDPQHAGRLPGQGAPVAPLHARLASEPGGRIVEHYRHPPDHFVAGGVRSPHDDRRGPLRVDRRIDRPHRAAPAGLSGVFATLQLHALPVRDRRADRATSEVLVQGEQHLDRLVGPEVGGLAPPRRSGAPAGGDAVDADQSLADPGLQLVAGQVLAAGHDDVPVAVVSGYDLPGEDVGTAGALAKRQGQLDRATLRGQGHGRVLSERLGGLEPQRDLRRGAGRAAQHLRSLAEVGALGVPLEQIGPGDRIRVAGPVPRPCLDAVRAVRVVVPQANQVAVGRSRHVRVPLQRAPGADDDQLRWGRQALARRQLDDTHAGRAEVPAHHGRLRQRGRLEVEGDGPDADGVRRVAGGVEQGDGHGGGDGLWLPTGRHPGEVPGPTLVGDEVHGAAAGGVERHLGGLGQGLGRRERQVDPAADAGARGAQPHRGEHDPGGHDVSALRRDAPVEPLPADEPRRARRAGVTPDLDVRRQGRVPAAAGGRQQRDQGADRGAAVGHGATHRERSQVSPSVAVRPSEHGVPSGVPPGPSARGARQPVRQ